MIEYWASAQLRSCCRLYRCKLSVSTAASNQTVARVTSAKADQNAQSTFGKIFCGTASWGNTGKPVTNYIIAEASQAKGRAITRDNQKRVRKISRRECLREERRIRKPKGEMSHASSTDDGGVCHQEKWELREEEYRRRRRVGRGRTRSTVTEWLTVPDRTDASGYDIRLVRKQRAHVPFILRGFGSE